ncbi:hypothetical protein AN652_14370 [Xanthomonas arboricola pv. pruni]|nr:hypothetical protein DK27_20920 [Xanthomonas arboricola pv. pruni]KPN09919.1 hypothetical protein AN652_14370 [Xanthomonas arboricola pv. pruni]OEH52160.1 hypothetical protein XapnCFBP3894_03970 [Xanthomonas arboricola pv. pruni]
MKLDHVQLDAFFLGCLRRFFAGIVLIHKRDLDRFTGRVLYLLSKRSDLRALLLICWRDLDGEQVSQRIDRHVHLASFLAFVAIVSGARSAFTGGL